MVADGLAWSGLKYVFMRSGGWDGHDLEFGCSGYQV